MLIRLDSGYLLNLAAVAFVSSDEMLAYFKQPVITQENSFQTAKCFGVGVTESDIERIASVTTRKGVTDDEK